MAKRLTKEGLEKLKKELKYLKQEKRKEIAEELKEVTAQGDLSENAAYDEAQQKYRANEERIKELRKVIGEAEVIEKKHNYKVHLGSFVRVKLDGKEKEYRIVDAEEADISENKISADSPLGKELLNTKQGETVTVKTPKGKQVYKILNIS